MPWNSSGPGPTLQRIATQNSCMKGTEKPSGNSEALGSAPASTSVHLGRCFSLVG